MKFYGLSDRPHGKYKYGRWLQCHSSQLSTAFSNSLVKMRRFNFSPSCILVSAALISLCSAVSSLKVDTTVGTVYGLANGTSPNVAQFLGIPYAEPRPLDPADGFLQLPNHRLAASMLHL